MKQKTINSRAIDAKWGPLYCIDCRQESPIPENAYALRRCKNCGSLKTKYHKRPPSVIHKPRTRSYYGISLLGKEMADRSLPP